MSTTVAAEPTKKPGEELPPVPREIEIEDQQAVALAKANFTRIALVEPEKVQKAIAGRVQSLELMAAASIKMTHGNDWTLYKGREGGVVGVLRDSGAVKVRKLMGIAIFGYKPLNEGYPSPKVTEELVDGKPVKVVELWADGLCNLTGETVDGIYYAIRSEDEFIGRERKRGKGDDAFEEVTLQDMKAACRTGLDAKIVRLLSGLRKVPLETLTAQGIKEADCHRGRGFGTAAERNTGKVASDDVKKAVAQLRDEVLRRVGGDVEAGKKLVKEITSNKEKGFQGFDTLDRLAHDWQVEQAWRNLKAHKVFGDAGNGEPAAAAAGAPPSKNGPPAKRERQPGEDD